MNETLCFIISLMVSLAAFTVAAVFFNWIKKTEVENAEIKRVGGLIKNGARTFLTKEYKILAIFAAIVMVLILIFLPNPIWTQDSFKNILSENISMSLAYLFGTVLSGIAGIIGIEVATNSNMRCAESAKKGIRQAFNTGFRGGAVMGMAVVGLGLMGVTIVYWLTHSSTILLGFSFGASSLALFAKVGGGIFTKTADISADLAGKVELNIPEDDPRNPAVIADNVGDNVGDVAGMGADLFDSNVAAFAATVTIASSISLLIGKENYIPLIFLYSALGLLASIIGVVVAKIGKKGSPTKALNNSTYATTGLFLILTSLATLFVDYDYKWNIWGATALGLLVGVIIGVATDYFTNDARKPVRECAKASELGPAFTVLSGTSYGFLSCFPAMAGIAVSALVSYKLCEPICEGISGGMFGISMAAIGMLSIVAMIVSNDAYGPIVDNARGLAEMGGLDDKVIEITDELDSAGNTVKAITKGFSISAAGLTVISLLGAFMSEVNTKIMELGNSYELLTGFDVMDPIVFFGILIGATIPAVFSALLIKGVDRNAQRMLKEIHHQFDTIEGLKEGKEGVNPDYDKCIAIATQGSIKELVVAGGITIVCTLLVGFIGGVKAIGGFLLGNIVVGLFLALYMSNAGGLWDNSKKYIEAGNNGGKGSVAHKAGVVGDTIGDPFKDTAGPSINTQITVVSLIASLLSLIFLTCSIF